jgi:hypothetical protein
MNVPLPLVRDVLDKQVFDERGLKVGKVDGIVLVPRQNRPPRVEALELHLPTACRRLWPTLGNWLERLQQWLDPQRAVPTRIRFEHVVKSGIDVQVDIDAARTNAFAWEDWVDTHLIRLIPGGADRGSKE